MFFLSQNHKIAKNKILTSRNYLNVDNFSFGQLNLKKNEREFVWTKALIIDHLTIYSSIFFSSLAYGIMMVLIALKLEANVKNEILISVSTICQILAGVLFSRFLPDIGKKFGMIKSICISSIIASIMALSLYKFINYPIWLFCIFTIGTSLFVSSVTRNTVMIDLAPISFRSFSISIGSLLVAFGNSLGTILFNYVGNGESLLTFSCASLFFFISAVIILRLKKIDSIIRQQKKISIYRYIISSPKIMFSGFAFSFAMSSCSAFAIIYGLKIGLNTSQASLLLTYLLLGTTAYIPLGYLCNHFNLRLMMMLFSIISFCCIYKISNLKDYENIHNYFFILFACLSGMKLPTIVLINEKYKSSQRLAVNSAFSQITLLGSVFGLLITGIFINTLNYSGLWLSCGGILFLHLIFCFANYTKKIIYGEIKLNNFSIFKKNIEPVELNEN
jgi:MFS family permease